MDRALAVLAMVALATAAGCGSHSSSPTSRGANSTPASTAASNTGAFVSSALPYRLVLPAGWSVYAISQGGGDPDEFRNSAGSQRLVVGYGFPAPGENLSDRVRANRTEETTAPGCTSDRKQDRPIEVAGKHGVLWSYTCAPDKSGAIPASKAYYLSAQTIYQRPGHRRVGYRFTVVMPLADKLQARPLLDHFLAGLTFLKVSDATIDR
jgi:hypothetical protein